MEEVRAVVTIDDDQEIMSQKMFSVASAMINGNKDYSLIRLLALNKEQQDEDDKYAQKVRETIERYKNMGQSIFQHQQEIVSGRKKESQFSKEEISELDKYFNQNSAFEQRIKNDRFAATEVTPLTGYWFVALKNFDITKAYIRDKDELILRNLVNITANFPEESSFEVKFEFKENEYFLNQVLVKSFYLNLKGEPIRTEGSIIEWLEGKDVCRKTVKKSQKNRRTGAIRVITHEVEDESFFNLFSSQNLEEVEMMGQRKTSSMLQQNKYLDRMNVDYDIARAVVDELLPYSLEYYLGVRKIRPKHSDPSDLKFLAELKDQKGDDKDSDDDDENEKKKKSEKKAKVDVMAKTRKNNTLSSTQLKTEESKQEQEYNECTQQ